MSVDYCAAHPDEAAAARCASCDRVMCLDCWDHNLDDHPTCSECLTLLTKPIPGLVPILLATIGLVVVLRIAWLVQPSSRWQWACLAFAAAVVLFSAWILTSRANLRRAGRGVTVRRPVSAPVARSIHPYRGALRRRVRWLAPPVSAAMAGAVVGSALIVTAAFVPAIFRLPLWIEIELVLASWWLVWTTTLATLLYRGWRVAQEADVRTRVPKSGRGVGGFDLALPEFELFGLIMVLLLAWLAAELFAPLLMLVAYALVVGGLRRVANDTHRCEDSLGRSIAWGAAWATAYTLPLLGLVLLIRWWR